MDAAQIIIRCWFCHPEGNATSSLAVHPDDEQRLEDWRAEHNIVTKWEFATVYGQRLKAFRPLTDRLLGDIQNKGIRDGQLCTVWVDVRHRGSKATMPVSRVEIVAD